jgi:flagellar biosynthesis protein FliR
MQLQTLLQTAAQSLLLWAPSFAVVLVRVAGMFVMMPFLGSSRVPRRVRALLVLTVSFAVASCVRAPLAMPGDLPTLTVALGGELIFGIAMGMIVALVFVAAQWAGEMIGQQMGFSIAQAFDPQFGSATSLVGDLYYMLTIVVFISPLVDGPASVIRGLHASFTALPPLSVGLNADVLDMMTRVLAASAVLAFQLAAPTLLTMLIVDLALGFVGKTMPQLNVMSAGLSIRVVVGMIVLIFGVHITGKVIGRALVSHVEQVERYYSGGTMPPGTH